MPPESPDKMDAINCSTTGNTNSRVVSAGHPQHLSQDDEQFNKENSVQGNVIQYLPPNQECLQLLHTPPPPILLVDSPNLPGMLDLQLGAEVQVENRITRRCSYEEMVHEEDTEFDFGMTSGLLTSSSASLMENYSSKEDLWKQCILKITQWAMILQEIFDEREISANLILMNSKCLCQKSSSICQRLNRLEYSLIDFLIDSNEDTPSEDDLIQIVEEVQTALRAGVSIQISKPNEAVIQKSSSIVEAALMNCEKVAYVKSLIESIVKLVNDLLNVPKCGHASSANLLDDSDRIRDISPTRLMEQDEEEDIRIRVESMFNGSNEDSDTEDDEMDTNNTARIPRKRKQFKKSQHSPTSSPSKRPRKLKSPQSNIGINNTAWGSMSAPAKICQTSSPALDLLETKKKVQRNSLYHWVLWREALRGEKDRVQTGQNITRKLSFN